MKGINYQGRGVAGSEGPACLCQALNIQRAYKIMAIPTIPIKELITFNKACTQLLAILPIARRKSQKRKKKRKPTKFTKSEISQPLNPKIQLSELGLS